MTDRNAGHDQINSRLSAFSSDFDSTRQGLSQYLALVIAEQQMAGMYVAHAETGKPVSLSCHGSPNIRK